ncbi:DUF2194 domain-containing protein [Roseivirga sp.]|uniref:DUF2194 domain-containing protein n=1 Tax=Roseivirga sp. TaxID=1964215 RepID=UPI003B526766
MMGWLTYHRIRLLLLLVLGLAMVGCNTEPESEVEEEQFEAQSPIVVYLVDEGFDLSRSYSTQLAKVFDYSKIPYASIPITAFNDDPYFPFETRVVYINNTSPLNEESKEILTEFVAAGGTLIFPSLNEDQSAGFLSGIKPGADYNYNLTSQGISFRVNLLPGIEGKTIYQLKKNTGLEAEAFKSDIQILAVSATDPQQPVIFEHSIGNGRVIHFNTGMELERQDRGLLFAPALKGLQGVPYPIANVSSVFIDDFPNPLYDIRSEPINKEFGITEADFVMNIWWPDMLKVSNRFDIDYSVYPCFNYNQLKQPPFIFKEWDLNRTIKNNRTVISTDWMVNQVLENQFELAFHGYNHESLTKDIWQTPEYIEAALNATRKKWKVNRFGAFPTSYVPPSNEIDSVGLVRFANAMPEVEFMSSTYDGDIHEGGGREFDIDPLEPRLFDFPRVTSGYTFNDFKTYNQESLYLFTGIWTHFIHPDDVYQLPDSTNTSAGDYGYRNAERLGWHASTNNRPGMLEEWMNYLETVVERHPSTRFVEVTTGGRITRDWRNSQYRYEENGDGFNVTRVSKKQWTNRNFYWNLFVEKGNELRVQNELEKLNITFSRTPFFGGVLYTLKSPEPQVIFTESVRLKGLGKYDLSEVFAIVNEQYEEYVDERDNFIEEEIAVDELLVEEQPVIEDSVAWYVSNENLKAATDMLRSRLEPQDQIDSVNFDQYALYLAYQEKPGEVWNFFDDIYQNKSQTLAISYVNYYLKTEFYPTVELNELWLRRMIEEDPYNIELIEEYLNFFYSEPYLDYVKAILNRLRLSGSEEGYALYIRYLIDFEPEHLTTELREKNPAQYPLLQPMATTITYAFSDEGLLQEALLWSDFSDEVPMKTILQWWIDLEAFNKMESVYLEYIADHPLDYEVKDFVSNVWYDIGEFERASLIANQLPDTTLLKEDFRKRLSSEVRTFESDIRKFLIVKTPSVIYQDTLKSLRNELRYQENSSIQYNTDYVVDNFNQSVWNNSVTYNLKTDSLNQHSLSVTYSDISDLNLNVFDGNNVPHSLYGFRYRYQTRENTTKPIFHAMAGLEQDDVSNTFLTVGAGISISNEKNFKSLAYTFSPVKTGPAISREVYWGQLIGYYESGYGKTFQTSVSPVLTHYTTGALEASLTGRFFYNTKLGTGSRFSPFAEAFVSGANALQEDGNPFWIIENRFYGGGGLAWTYGRDQSRKLYARVEAGAFYDSYTDSFLRLTGNFSFPIKKFTYITGQFEFFNQALYYSNGFQFGLKHYFRRRKQYAYKPREYEDWYD